MFSMQHAALMAVRPDVELYSMLENLLCKVSWPFPFGIECVCVFFSCVSVFFFFFRCVIFVGAFFVGSFFFGFSFYV